MAYRSCTCPWCGEQFQTYSPKQETCSRHCGQALRVERAGGRLSQRRRSCEVCSADYRANYAEQRTCGRACGVELRRRSGTLSTSRPKWPTSRIWIYTCGCCGVLFIARRRRKIPFCSRRCADREYDKKRKRKNPQPAPCIICGTGMLPFPPRRCDVCLRERNRQGRSRRAALKKGVATERYTLAEIAVRDRYKCGLCKGRVGMDRIVPHPKAPTIDHVVPLGDGGDDTRANVQLAHFRCNCSKRVGGSQQLAMIG